MIYSPKRGIAIFASVCSVLLAFFFVEDRYISSTELGAFETQIVQTLKSFQDKTNLRLDLRLYEELMSQIRNYRKDLLDNPTDLELRELLKQKQKYAEVVKRRIDDNLKMYRLPN